MNIINSLNNKVIKNAGWIVGERIIQMVISLVVSLATARYLGPSNYGLVNYAASFISFFAPICTLGFNSLMVKELVDKPEREGEIIGTAIVYRTDKFELIDSTTMWLTDTPTEVSKVEGSESRRIVTVAIFKRLSDGKQFAYANTHLDNSTEEVREKQLRYLDQHVKSFTDLPYIVTGDFNFTRSSSTYKVATEELGYENCSILATEARNRANATFVAGGIIDYCFRSAGSPFEPYLYAVCTEPKNGKVISDHYPILFLFDVK